MTDEPTPQPTAQPNPLPTDVPTPLPTALPGESADPPAEEEPTAEAPRRSQARGCAIELVQTLGLTLLLFFGIQTFITQPFEVEQQSMEQTLEPGDYVLVDKLSPRWDAYDRGDIVVFAPPEAWRGPSRTPFIKRVIGLAGETVEIGEDGLVYVDGVALDEPYLYALNGPEPTTTSVESAQWVVPPDGLFVMGDHRASSQDSREFGPIDSGDVVGRAALRYWPAGRLGILPTPTYP